MLYFKEIKKVAFSITFAVLVFALIAMSVSQDVLNFSDMIITEPQPGENYGIQAKEIPEQIMPAAFDSLCKEFTANKYIAYPIGFYKTVKLGEKDRENMAEIISALSGVPTDNILASQSLDSHRGISGECSSLNPAKYRVKIRKTRTRIAVCRRA